MSSLEIIIFLFDFGVVSVLTPWTRNACSFILSCILLLSNLQNLLVALLRLVWELWLLGLFPEVVSSLHLEQGMLVGIILSAYLVVKQLPNSVAVTMFYLGIMIFHFFFRVVSTLAPWIRNVCRCYTILHLVFKRSPKSVGATMTSFEITDFLITRCFMKQNEYVSLVRYPTLYFDGTVKMCRCCFVYLWMFV